MDGLKILALAAIAASCFAVTIPKNEAQVSVNIGVAHECPYGYYDVPPYDCAPMATTARNGLREASSLARARGFMVQPTSTATSIIVSILSTAITAQSQTVATNPSRESVSIRLPTSNQTK